MDRTLVAMDGLGRMASVFRIATLSGDMQNPRELQRRAERVDRGDWAGHSKFVKSCCSRERAWALPLHRKQVRGRWDIADVTGAVARQGARLSRRSRKGYRSSCHHAPKDDAMKVDADMSVAE